MSQFSENKRPGRLPVNEARPAPPEPTPDEKPFRLAKSFSLAAIILIFASVLTLAAVVSRQAEIIITKRVEDDTIKLMTNLNHQMYENFLKVVSNPQTGRSSLRDQAQRELLSRVIGNTIYGFDLKKVIIYNDQGQVVYATDDTPVPSPAEDLEALTEVVRRYLSIPRKRFIVPQIKYPWRDEFTLQPSDDLTASEAERRLRPAPSAAAYHLPNLQFYLRVSPFSRGPADDYNQATLDHMRPADGDQPARPDDEQSAEYETQPDDDEQSAEDENAQSADDAQSAQDENTRSADDAQSAQAETDSPTVVLPAPIPTMADGEDAFLEYQRSQTVFRHEVGGYLLFNFLPRGEFVLRAYKVMEDFEAPEYYEGLSGVLEITRDLTPEYRQIARLQYFALGVAVFLALVLTIALRWVVSRGEAILNKRNLERQALRERLDQAERLAGLGSMVATVAHEIRNPLGIIHSTADVLNRFLSRDPDQARLARAIVEEADRLSTVVTEFLDFARPPQPRPTPIVVEEILEEILAFLEITLVRAGVEIRCDFRADQSAVMGDGPMLHRAFLNILMNAVQAMDDGGLITLATRLEKKDGEDWLTIAISDTGPGLGEEAAKKMFSPFYTTKAKGTGLGLVIVRNIVEGHGGRIEMISRSPSKKDDDTGLTVIIRLKTG